MTNYRFVTDLQNSTVGTISPETQINSREINETALRMGPELADNERDWVTRSTDYKTLEIDGPSDIALDRLQKAWGLALGKCPGKKSEF